jgi:hypothetical protein
MISYAGHPERSEGSRKMRATDYQAGFFAPLRMTRMGGLYPCHSVESVVLNLDGLPAKLWSVLHRSQHLLADPGHATWQARGDSLCAIAAGHALRDLRQTGTPGGVREPAADGEYVRNESRSGPRLSHGIGEPDPAGGTLIAESGRA